jgi:hypothetical protein
VEVGQRLLPQRTGTVASLVRFSAMGDGDDARKSRRYVVAFAFLIALSAQAKAQPLIDDQTPCSVAVRAFDSQDKEKIREAEAFIESVFEQVDQRRRDSGEPGILAQPNDRGASTLMSVAIGFCRQRQKETIRNEATRAYRVIRAMHGFSSPPEK